MSTVSTPPRKRGRPSLNDGETVLKNLYHVAFFHFFISGIEGANMQLIAKEAGVSRQMIHNRFGSKELFFKAVLEYGDAYLQKKFIYEGCENLKTPWDLLNHLGLQVFETLVDPDTIVSFRTLDLAVFRHKDVAEMHEKSLNNAYKRFGKMLKDIGKANGYDVAVDKAAMRDFLSLIRGYAQPIIQGRENIPSKNTQKKDINLMIVRFLRGLGFGEPPK